jgi:hypothetical protein
MVHTEDSDTESESEESETDAEGAELLDLAEDVGLMDLYHEDSAYVEEGVDNYWYDREICSSPVR